MARFCGNCGSPLSESSQFCGSCGKPAKASANAQTPAVSAGATSTTTSQSSVGFTPVAQTGQQPSPVSPPSVQPTPPTKSGSIAKIAIAVVGVLCVGGLFALAGGIYIVHKVHQKVKAVEHQVLGQDSESDTSQQKSSGGLTSLLGKVTGSADSRESDGASGDPCRFLSKDDVSHAAGIAITRTEAKDVGCIYYAKGDPADMVSKHMTAATMGQAAANGNKVSSQQEQMMRQITGAFFKQQEANDKDLSKEAQSGEVPVLSVSISTGNAELEMKLNRMAFNKIRQSGKASIEGKTTDQVGTGDLSNFGDEAYEMGGTGLIMRKGQTVVRMMFPYCPCDANAIKPLLAEIAGKL